MQPSQGWPRRARHLAVILGVVFVLGGARNASAQGEDGRNDFEIGLFTGFAIDSFAAQELKDYINPEESGDVREQLIAGVDFAYRLFRQEKKTGTDGTATTGRLKDLQLWIYGETIHGARSGNVNCDDANNVDTDTCKIAKFENPTKQAALAIFREATSLEGFFGLRAELLKLRGDSRDATAMLYLKAQAGFLTTAGTGGDIVDLHHIGAGLELINGVFQGSYVELGVGRNDLFQKAWPRAKVDAFLAISPKLTGMKDGKRTVDGKPIELGSDGATHVADSPVRPFLQIVIDPDLANGADSIQTFIGVDIDILEAFR